MRRFLIVSLLVPSLAAAAPVFTPGGGIASSRINPTYEIGQDGIAKFSNVDPRTLLGGQPISTVLSQMGQNSQGLATEIARAQSAEEQAVKKQDIGSTVAGLDSSGSVNAPLSTPGYAWGQAYVGAGYIPAGNGYTARPSFSAGWNNGDPFLYPNTTLVGGHTDHDDGYLKVIASPWSEGDAGGSAVEIYDSVGDQGTGRNGIGNDDGGTLYTGTQMTPFRVRAGSQLTDGSDNIARTVTLTGTTAIVTPAFNAAQLRLLRQWMRIYTNWDAAGGNSTGGDYWANWNGQLLSTGFFIPNVYYGYIGSWRQDGNSTVINIVSDPFGRANGWRTEKNTATTNEVPGTVAGDIIDADSARPTWTYGTTSIFIGGANKKFNSNRTVSCHPNGNPDIFTRQCEADEIDLWGSDEVNTNDPVAVAKEKALTRQRNVRGITISYGGYRPDDDSYNLHLAGSTSNDIVMEPEWYTTAIQSDAIYVAPMAGPSLDVSKGNTQAVIASFASSTNTGEQTFGPFTYIRPMWWAERFASDGSGTDFSNETINYGVSVGGLRGSVGTIQEHIELNPKAYKNGIGLCGYNSCDYVDSHGDFISSGNISTGSGSALYTLDPNGSNAAYAYSNAAYQMNIAFNPQSGSSTAYSGAQGAQALHIGGSLVVDEDINTTGNLQVQLGKSFGLLDGMGALIAYQYLQDATDSTGPVAHQVVAAKNKMPGTYYIDGAFGTGGAAKLASVDVVTSALFEQGSVIPAGKSYGVQSAAGTTYLTADKGGNFTVVQGASNTGGGLKTASYVLADLPTTVASDGTQVWCSDCKVNGAVGTPVWWHTSVSGWRDGTNSELVAQ